VNLKTTAGLVNLFAVCTAPTARAAALHPIIGNRDRLLAPNVYEIAAVLDLNGDGKLEVIVHSFYYEGGQTTIYRCDPDKIEAALSVERGA
jgi:hypothetical protein